VGQVFNLPQRTILRAACAPAYIEAQHINLGPGREVDVKNSIPAAALRARWVIPVDGLPIQGGIVTVASGRIVAVGENLSGRTPHDLGDVALLPGLVNAHTHLEFSLLNAPLGEPGMEFSRWIGRVVEWRRELAGSWTDNPDGAATYRRQAVERGVAESLATGVAAIGEIATPDWPRKCFETAEVPHATPFLELLGAAPAKADVLLALADEYVSSLRDSRNLRAGLSPHAPYTISLGLLRGTGELSVRERIPVAMHLAESPAELELLASHCGPLVERLQSLDAWYPGSVPRGIRPRDYLELLAQAYRAIVIHGNYLLPDEWRFLSAHREKMSLVYCPRTHAYFGHAPYPLGELLAAGVRVAVGTDSRASNPDLDLWAELQHIAAHHPDVPPETILRMGTLDGAEALGISDEFGSITAGKRAALAVVPIDSAARDPLASLLGSDLRATLGCEQVVGPSHPLRYLLK
jgi:cytosine/adenosine deaminase-related metal-dependent hydrolase